MTEPGGNRPDIWKAVANPVRRAILDRLASGPRTTGELDQAIEGLSRFAVMQHLSVLVGAGLVVVRRRGKHRYNHLNPVPLRRAYEQWVGPLADQAADEMLSLERHVERGGTMSEVVETTRTVRIETELEFHASPERLFRALTEESLQWFPHTYGEKVEAVIVETHVGGRHYEDWGGGRGHLYGHVTLFDPPFRLATRGRIMPGTILDTSYELEAHGETTKLSVSKVATGPMTQEEADGVRKFGDIANFQDALRSLVES